MQVNHHLNCNDKCLIYLLSCKVCGLQYVVSTTDKFRLRWDNYKENNRKALRREEHMQPELFDGSDPTRREEYGRKILETAAPYELNTLS